MSAQLAVVGFVTVVPVLLFLMAILKESFVKNPVLNTLIRGGLYTIGTALFAMAASVVWHIATISGLGVGREVSVYFYIAVYLGYGVTAAFAWGTIKKTIEVHLMEKKKQRGEDEPEED